MKLNKEQREIIEKHLELLKNTYITKTVRGATNTIKQELMNLYIQLGYRKQNINCNVCVISFLETLYSLYLDDLEEEKNLITEVISEPVKETIIEEEKVSEIKDKEVINKTKGKGNGKRKGKTSKIK